MKISRALRNSSEITHLHQPLLRGVDMARLSLVKLAIQNPYLVIVFCILVVIFGGVSLLQLPKDLLPVANLPAIQILSFYPGMPVEHVEQNLSARIERNTGIATGVVRQESKSLVGVSIVKNFFNQDTDLNAAISQTSALVMSVLGRLPPGTQPPLILPFDPTAADPIALVAVSGNKSESELYDIARYSVRNNIQTVLGAVAPTVMGGAERQVIVYLDPAKMKKFNFSPNEITDRLGRLNTFIPSGNVKIGDQDLQISSNGFVSRVSEMNDFPLRSENGTLITLGQIGEAKDSSKIQTNIVRIDGKRQVYVPIYRQSGANTLKVVDDIYASIQRLETQLPGVHLKLISDQTNFIRNSVIGITEEALIGSGLAALLVLILLGSGRAMAAIMLSLPLSLLIAFFGLKATGQTINAMTLGGIALSVGVMIDNSIVVLEVILKKLAIEKTAKDAAIAGASEVAMPVFASTLSTITVFIPVIFLNGITKILFSALAKTVIFIMCGSFVFSMTVVPLFAAFCFRKQTSHQDNGILLFFQGLLQRLTRFYVKVLTLAFLQKEKTLILVFSISIFLTPILLSNMGTELFPVADSGNLNIAVRMKSGTRIENAEGFAIEIEEKLKGIIPNTELVQIITNIGVSYNYSAAFTPNTGPQDMFFLVELLKTRKQSSQFYAKKIREIFKRDYPSIDIGIELGGLLTTAMNGGLRAPIDIQIDGPSPNISHEIAQNLALEIKNIRGASDVRVQQRLDAPRIFLDVDRLKSSNVGISTDEIIKNVVSAVSGSSTFSPLIWVNPRSGIDYQLGVQFEESKVSKLSDVLEIPITGRRQERPIPLRNLASVSLDTTTSEISHSNLRTVVDIFLSAEGRDIGGLAKEIRAVLEKTKMPVGYNAEIRGEIMEMNSAIRSLGLGFLLAISLVYLILVIQFESFLYPLVVMMSVPLGLVGMMAMLVFTHTYFSIQAAIGSIFLIGIEVSNGVLLLAFIRDSVKNMNVNESVESAIIHGSKERFRPVLTTWIASIAGMLPMAIGAGLGSEANIPLGRAVVGGQLVSTLCTLFVVPLLFKVIYERQKQKS